MPSSTGNRVVVFVLTLCLLTSCVLRRLGFSHAEMLLTSEIDGYFDLHTDQEEFVERELTRFLQAISQSEIRDLKVLLRDIGERTTSSLSASDVSSLYQRWDEIFSRMLSRLPIGQFLATIDEKQVVNLIKEQEKRQKKRDRERGKTEKERLAKRLAEVEKRLQGWIGSLHPGQKEIIREHVLHYPRDDDSGNARAVAQRQFVDVLRSKKDAVFLQQYALDSLVTPYRALPVERARLWQSQREADIALYSALLSTLDERQRVIFKKELTRLAEDLDALTRSEK